MARRPPPTRTLRAHPDLDQLRRQAKDLLAAFAAGDIDAADEVKWHYRSADPATFALHDAQLVLARAYGFDSWPKLKAYVDGVTVARLADAVRDGDVARVRAMLKVRPELVNLDMAGNDEHRAVHYAVLNRSPEMVRALMQHGADARTGIWPYRDATRALTIASERGYDEIVAIILEEEARRHATVPTDVAAPAMTWLPPPPADGSLGQDDVIAMLDANPATIHARNPQDGSTPLHIAAAMLWDRVVAWLLDRGADVKAAARWDMTPLDLVGCGRGIDRIRSGEHISAIAEMLMARGAMRTPRWAVATGNAEWLRARHAEGTLTNPAVGEGLLTRAVAHGRPDMLALLLDLGFDPDERTRVEGLEEVVYSWGVPLQLCARSGKFAMAEMLLERGADPNGQVYAAGTPVSTAYRERDAAMLTLLQRYGGVVTAETAGCHRDTDLARRLLAADAEGRLPEGTVSPERTVAEELLDGDCGDPEIVRMALERIDWPRDDPRWYRRLRCPLAFWNHIPWIESEKWRFDRGTYLTCFRLILDRCHANVRGTFGRTILHDVVAMGRREGVPDWVTEDEVVAFATTLLDAGARLDVRDDLLESTPLAWACRWGRVKVVTLMLERGADPVEAHAEPWARPEAWASTMKHEAVLTVLREHRSDYA